MPRIFFNNLKNVLEREPQFCDGTRVYNLDETATKTVHNLRKVVAAKGAKQISKCTSAEKGTLVTTCCIVSATANTVPPDTVFPRVNFIGMC